MSEKEKKEEIQEPKFETFTTESETEKVEEKAEEVKEEVKQEEKTEEPKPKKN